MGLGDMVDKAKEALGGNAESVDGAIDSAAEAIKDKAPDQLDGAIDTAAEKGKELL